METEPGMRFPRQWTCGEALDRAEDYRNAPAFHGEDSWLRVLVYPNRKAWATVVKLNRESH
jgi:hypothetical protein